MKPKKKAKLFRKVADQLELQHPYKYRAHYNMLRMEANYWERFDDRVKNGSK